MLKCSVSFVNTAQFYRIQLRVDIISIIVSSLAITASVGVKVTLIILHSHMLSTIEVFREELDSHVNNLSESQYPLTSAIVLDTGGATNVMVGRDSCPTGAQLMRVGSFG